MSFILRAGTCLVGLGLIAALPAATKKAKKDAAKAAPAAPKVGIKTPGVQIPAILGASSLR